MIDKTDIAISADGVPIHYKARGDGDIALVFVHGWCCNRSYWEKQLDHFAPHHRVVTIDLGGHGESGLKRESWSMAAFAGDVVAVVEKLCLDKVVLVGHSMGGSVIVEAGRRMPERVSGLVAADTFGDVEHEEKAEQIQALIDWLAAASEQEIVEAIRTQAREKFVPTSDDALVERIVADMSSVPLETAAGATTALLRYRPSDLRQALHEVTAPVITINSASAATDVEAANRHGIEVLFMSGTGHFVMLEDPETFNRLLDETVEKLVASTSP